MNPVYKNFNVNSMRTLHYRLHSSKELNLDTNSTAMLSVEHSSIACHCCLLSLHLLQLLITSLLTLLSRFLTLFSFVQCPHSDSSFWTLCDQYRSMTSTIEVISLYLWPLWPYKAHSTAVRASLFSQRVINSWNKLPVEVDISSVKVFFFIIKQSNDYTTFKAFLDPFYVSW